MLLNRIEFALMNNPVRACVQRRFEASRLLRMGGALHGGTALEIGCGRGIGVQIILDQFGATAVDAFDLDSRMIALASRRIKCRRSIRLFVADCTVIPVKDEVYDAVFDFGIIHHVPKWREALLEVVRVLKPGGRFYAEEVFGTFITHPITRRFLAHPQFDRFGAFEFQQAILRAGLTLERSQTLAGLFGWFTASKPLTCRETH